MARYAQWDDIVGRYQGVAKKGGSNDVGSSYIAYVENQIDGLLSSKFTVPFSNNNITVRDLTIDGVYIKAGNLNIKDRRELRKEWHERIANLKSGYEAMLTTSGDVITTVGGTVWSTTKDYHPTFGMGNIADFHVDSSQIYVEDQERDDG